MQIHLGVKPSLKPVIYYTIKCLFVFLLLGVGDLQFSLDAYVCALASVLSQAIYLTYVQKTGVEEGISALGVLHLNSVNCIPILLIYVLTTKEISVSLHYTGYVNSGFEVFAKH